MAGVKWVRGVGVDDLAWPGDFFPRSWVVVAGQHGLCGGWREVLRRLRFFPAGMLSSSPVGICAAGQGVAVGCADGWPCGVFRRVVGSMGPVGSVVLRSPIGVGGCRALGSRSQARRGSRRL